MHTPIINTSVEKAVPLSTPSLQPVVRNRPQTDINELRLLSVTHEPGSNYLWLTMNENAPICFTQSLVNELSSVQRYLANLHQDLSQVRFQIISSNIPGVFSCGGDLKLFVKLIKEQDRDALRHYARSAVDLVYAMATGHQRNLYTIAAVDGRCMGGGFECALAADTIIASEKATFSFPEITFNMIPGMGAFCLLRRRLSTRDARELIMSGKSYTAREMQEMGVVDLVCKEDELSWQVISYMNGYRRQLNGIQALKKVIDIDHHISLDDMYKVADVWVDNAFDLTARDLRVMEAYLKAQSKIQVVNE